MIEHQTDTLTTQIRHEVYSTRDDQMLMTKGKVRHLHQMMIQAVKRDHVRFASGKITPHLSAGSGTKRTTSHRSIEGETEESTLQQQKIPLQILGIWTVEQQTTLPTTLQIST